MHDDDAFSLNLRDADQSGVYFVTEEDLDTLADSAPVSYTHLDVYKRQHKIKRANKRWSLKPRQLTSTVMAMMM